MSERYPERFRYLKELTEELQSSNSVEARRQVLANLANFAYDAGNGEFLVRLKVPGVLVSLLDGEGDPDADIRHFAAGGICNLCLHPTARCHLIRAGAVIALVRCLQQYLRDGGSCDDARDSQTVLHLMGALLFLLAQDTRDVIVEILPLVETLKHSPDRRLANCATVFANRLMPNFI